MSEPAIRPARVEDAPRLTEIAHAAKRHWGYPERWMEEWRDALTLTPEAIRRWRVRAAVSGEAVLGFHAVAADGNAAALEHLWIDPPHMGRGIGRMLFEDALRIAAEQGAREMVIDSDPHAEAFYLRLGARRAGETPADVDGTPRTLPRLVIALG